MRWVRTQVRIPLSAKHHLPTSLTRCQPRPIRRETERLHVTSGKGAGEPSGAWVSLTPQRDRPGEWRYGPLFVYGALLASKVQFTRDLHIIATC